MASFPNIGALAAHFERAAMRLPAEIHAALTERAIDVYPRALLLSGGDQCRQRIAGAGVDVAGLQAH